MSRQVEFFFDYGSPFSYLADTQLAALVQRTGATVVYRPMLLGAVLKETGNASPMTVPAKVRYMGVELQRWARHYGVPFAANKFFPINTMRLMRGAVAAQHAECFAEYHRAIYPAFWVDSANLGEPEVIRTVLGKAGLNQGRYMDDAAPNPQQARHKPDDNTREDADAQAKGVVLHLPCGVL